MDNGQWTGHTIIGKDQGLVSWIKYFWAIAHIKVCFQKLKKGLVKSSYLCIILHKNQTQTLGFQLLDGIRYFARIRTALTMSFHSFNSELSIYYYIYCLYVNKQREHLGSLSNRRPGSRREGLLYTS